jgi:surfactin synthase thioesterase subunit
MRLREAPITTARGMAEALLPIVAFKLTESNANNNIGDNTESSSSVAVPYIVVAHSVGTWLAYEFLSLLKQKGGIPPPLRVFISAMPSPNIPFNQRPWRQQRTLEEADFIEECRGWDISEVVFSAAMWPTYQPLLRADFTLFDEYEFGGMEGGDREGEGEVFADVPKVVAFWGTRDKRVKEHHVKGWEKFLGEGAGGRFELRMIDGNHLWPLDKEAKAEWLQHIVVELEKMGQEK